MRKTRQTFGFRKLNNVLEKVTKPICAKNGFATHKIVTDWENIIGPKLSSICYPTRLTFQAEKNVCGILSIGVENPGYSLEIQANECSIVEKIAAYLGYRAVSRIKVEIALSSKRPIQPIQQIKFEHNDENSWNKDQNITDILSEIIDPTLKKTLTNLASLLPKR